MKNEKIAKRCNLCKSEALEDKTEQLLFANGAVEEIFSRRCFLCKQLLYGRVKRIKQGGGRIGNRHSNEERDAHLAGGA